MTADRLMKMLKSPAIRFAQPEYLNDPYECHLTFDRIKCVDSYRTFRKLSQPELTDEELERCVEIAEDQLVIDGLLEYRKRRNSFGVLSLTEDPLQMLMWSHYGDEHKGASVELDLWDSNLRPGSEGGDKYSDLQQVKYASEKVFGVPLPETIINVLSTKAIDWSYEREWRLIRTLNTLREADAKNEIYVCDLDLSAIKTIYLGARFPADKIPDLSNITSSPEGKHIKIIKLDIAPHKFELRETDIEKYGWKLLHREHHFREAAKEALECLPMDDDK